MNTFANAIKNQEARTWNGMKAQASSGNPVCDLFYGIGASRGKDIIPQFLAAYTVDPEKALRVAAWARDIRGGSGERKLFRDILSYLEKNGEEKAARALMEKIPELGRWDDFFALTGKLRDDAFKFIAAGLEDKSARGLVAKWMPRKGPEALALREFFALSPKKYRKMLVGLTNVVETAMCQKKWDSIEFGKIPSLASARYKKAFGKNAKDSYGKYLEGLKKGTEKVNAGAVYPYDVLKTAFHGDRSQRELIVAQWNALPNYVGEANILPMVDVSGSMTMSYNSPGLLKSGLTPMVVAVSLGLYLADKNKGKFNGCFLTFSSSPELLNLSGDVLQKMDQMMSSSWAMSTNLHAAFDKVLDVAKRNKVPQEEMPEAILILSDMQFNVCQNYDDSAIQMIERKYENAGYRMPKVVFWNLKDAGNKPVSFDKNGTALVSGFSPAIVKQLLANELKEEDFTPEAIMMRTIMQDRYKLNF